MTMCGEGAPQRQLFLAENAALVQANLTPRQMSPQDWSLWWSPASSAPQLWRKAVWHCLASWREKAGERKRKLRGEGEKEGRGKDNEERKREM